MTDFAEIPVFITLMFKSVKNEKCFRVVFINKITYLGLADRLHCSLLKALSEVLQRALIAYKVDLLDSTMIKNHIQALPYSSVPNGVFNYKSILS